MATTAVRTKARRSPKTTSKRNTRFKRYEKKSMELWKRPATKIIVGGLAIAALYPLAAKMFNRYPKIDSFFRRNLDLLEEKLERLSDKISSSVAAMKSESDLEESRH